MNDFWRAVAGYPNYLVSRTGEVWSLVRLKLLSPVEGARGYLLVNLYRDGKPKNFLIHRLVATAFLGPIPSDMQVNHKDGNKQNNCVENLEFMTAEDNRAHALRTGLIKRGEENPGSKLTDEMVRLIRQMRANGIRVRYIANHFDVCEKTIYLVCRGLMWRHVD